MNLKLAVRGKLIEENRNSKDNPKVFSIPVIGKINTFEKKNMRNYITLFFLMITTCGVANEFHGYWTGNFMYKGSGWPMRLHIVQTEDSISAMIDIPNLVLAEMEIPVHLSEDTLVVKLPFGFGVYKYLRVGDKLEPVGSFQYLTFRISSKPPYRIEQISWKNGDQTLFGSIYLPDSIRSHPLLIRLHGSEVGDRSHWEYRSWADYFARMGIATVVFDRRESGGFKLLAQDAMSLIEEMKKRSDIDSNKIILNGGSQAAYISFMANALSDDVNYLLLSGVPAVSLIEQERQSLIYRMRFNGESQSDIEDALGYQNLYFHYIMTGDNWKALQKASREAQSTSWATYSDQPESESDLEWWRTNFNAYQPQIVIPQVQIPTLLLFGENDVITPPSINVSQLKFYLSQSQNSDYQITICPEVGHSLEVEMGYNRWGDVVYPQRSPVMFKAIEQWLDRYGLRY